MRLSFADEGLAAIDAVSGLDSACLFVFEDERPLRGLAGYVDWRLCGGLSRILKEGRFVGASGDALLFPSAGRIPSYRIFCFGAGPRAGFSKGAFSLLVRRAGQALSKAGVKSVALALPAPEGVDAVELARVFLADGATAFKGERMVLFGDARALLKGFREAGGSMKGLEIDREPLGASSLPAGPKAAKAGEPFANPPVVR